VFAFAGLGLLCGAELWRLSNKSSCDVAPEDDDDEADITPEERKKLPAPGKSDGLPIYTRADVAKHTRVEDKVWVTYKDGVYDITEFIEGHPGGESKILMAAGKSVDPYWNVYQQHFNSGFPREMLESMRIGTLAPGEAVEQAFEDPYALDPVRHPSLIYHQATPCNAELPEKIMMDNWMTPNELWFVRHHHPVPLVNETDYKLQISGEGCKTVELTLSELKEKFEKIERVVTIQCSGNRRSHYDKVRKAQGIPWNVGAVSTAKFGGVRLRDVLLYAGLKDPEAVGAEHVQFIAVDEMLASVPMDKAFALAGDVMLAYEMNGEDMPPDHGYPLRAIVPGHVGVRNVKWVQSVVVSKEEAEGPWQRGVAYKGFAGSVTDLKSLPTETIDRAIPVQEVPIQSVIVEPQSGASIQGESLKLKGWAFSGGGRGIVRVEVSIDGGKTWSTANLNEGSEQKISRAWAWTFWSAEVPVPSSLKGRRTDILCRATDAAYNTQPESMLTTWNIRGLVNASWHRKTVNVEN